MEVKEKALTPIAKSRYQEEKNAFKKKYLT